MTVKRRLPRAIGLAVLAVYGPTLVPFVLGPLTTCAHCVTSYLKLLPIVPGFLAGALVFGRGGDAIVLAAAGTATLLLLAASFVAARNFSTCELLASYIVLGLLIGTQCHFLGHALRA